MVDVNPIIPIITLNVNTLIHQLKGRDCHSIWKIKEVVSGRAQICSQDWIHNRGSFFFFFFLTYFWLCWVFVSVHGLSLVAASGGHSSSWCVGLSLSWPLLLWSTSSRRSGSVVVAHGPSCSTACGIFPDQGSNPCPLHWQADAQPLRHQGSPFVK